VLRLKFGVLNLGTLTMQKLIKISLLLTIAIAISLNGCKQRAANQVAKVPPEYKVFTVQRAPYQRMLYFASRLMPLNCQPLASPADGVVTQKTFQYGQEVKSGELLFTIQSLKEQTDYQAALTRYFQAKQDFMHNSQDYENNAKLWEKGIVAKEVYDNSQRAYFTSRLNLLQAEAAFKKFLKTPEELKVLDQLSSPDIGNLDRILQFDKTVREINVYSPLNGLAVFQEKVGGDSKFVNVGDEVKVGQMLICIASSQGLSLGIQVNEANIQDIFVGQRATVTMDALADKGMLLQGYIESIETQAKGGDQLPTFFVRVVIPKVTVEQAKLIKIGMSAKVGFSIKHEPHILIPIEAVDHYLDKAKVKTLDKATGKITETIVETGETTINDVAIISGLKEGDQVLVPNKTD